MTEGTLLENLEPFSIFFYTDISRSKSQGDWVHNNNNSSINNNNTNTNNNDNNNNNDRNNNK